MPDRGKRTKLRVCRARSTETGCWLGEPCWGRVPYTILFSSECTRAFRHGVHPCIKHGYTFSGVCMACICASSATYRDSQVYCLSARVNFPPVFPECVTCLRVPNVPRGLHTLLQGFVAECEQYATPASVARKVSTFLIAPLLHPQAVAPCLSGIPVSLLTDIASFLDDQSLLRMLSTAKVRASVSPSLLSAHVYLDPAGHSWRPCLRRSLLECAIERWDCKWDGVKRT
jgi:hypothetical protein